MSSIKELFKSYLTSRDEIFEKFGVTVFSDDKIIDHTDETWCVDLQIYRLDDNGVQYPEMRIQTSYGEVDGYYLFYMLDFDEYCLFDASKNIKNIEDFKKLPNVNCE